jgi:hypothetical protein
MARSLERRGKEVLLRAGAPEKGPSWFDHLANEEGGYRLLDYYYYKQRKRARNAEEESDEQPRT